MDKRWGSGNPNTYLPMNKYFVAYDHHEYIKYIPGLATTKDAYLNFARNLDVSGDKPVIVGEWSLSVNTAVEWTAEWNPYSNAEWYRKFWAAQVVAYEKAHGWVFWTWKTTGTLNDPRGDYQKAVEMGIMPKNPDDAYAADIGAR